MNTIVIFFLMKLNVNKIQYPSMFSKTNIFFF